MRFLFPQPLLAHAMDPPRGSSLPIDILVPVTVGTPPLLVEMSVDFRSSVTRFTDRDLCSAGQHCFAPTESSSLKFLPSHSSPAEPNLIGKGLLMVSDKVSVGSANLEGVPFAIQTSGPVPPTGGVLGLGPNSSISKRGIITVDSHRIAQPDGSSKPGFTMTVSSDIPSEGPDDMEVRARLPADASTWSTVGTPMLNFESWLSEPVTVDFTPNPIDVISIPMDHFDELLRELTRRLVSVRQPYNRLYVPCADGAAHLPRVSVRLAGWDIELDVRGIGMPNLLMPPRISVSDREFCPTLIVGTPALRDRWNISPHLIPGNPTVFLDGRNRVMHFRRIPIASRLDPFTPRPHSAAGGAHVHGPTYIIPSEWLIQAGPVSIANSAIDFTGTLPRWRPRALTPQRYSDMSLRYIFDRVGSVPAAKGTILLHNTYNLRGDGTIQQSLVPGAELDIPLVVSVDPNGWELKYAVHIQVDDEVAFIIARPFVMMT